jgi:uncharacterized lipoprotein YmbA
MHPTLRPVSLRLALTALSLLGLVACTSAPPDVTYFLLRPDTSIQSGPVEAPYRVGLGRVAVAPYLARSAGLQIETLEGEIHSAVQYQWAEDLAAGVRGYLDAAMSEQLGHRIASDLTDRRKWDYAVDVFIEQLHGTMSGQATLIASFVVRDEAPGESTSLPDQHHFAESRALPAEGYAALVETEKALLATLAEKIAQAVRTHVEARGARSAAR